MYHCTGLWVQCIICTYEFELCSQHCRPIFIWSREEHPFISNARRCSASAAVSTWSDDIVSLAEEFTHLTQTISHFQSWNTNQGLSKSIWSSQPVGKWKQLGRSGGRGEVIILLSDLASLSFYHSCSTEIPVGNDWHEYMLSHMEICTISWLHYTLSSCRNIGFRNPFFATPVHHGQTTGSWACYISYVSNQKGECFLFFVCMYVLYYRVCLLHLCCCNCVHSRHYEIMITKL